MGCQSTNSQALKARRQMRGNILSKNGGIIGVSDHGGWAVLVAVARDGTLLDRRRVELVDEGLPKLPHHHECQGLPPDKAVALVERVRVSAERHAVLALGAVVMAVPRILGVALRNCPQLPPAIAERIKDYRAQNVADWVMYRKALASAAEERGCPSTGTTRRRCWVRRARHCAARTLAGMPVSSRPATRCFTNRLFQREMVGGVISSRS